MNPTPIRKKQMDDRARNHRKQTGHEQSFLYAGLGGRTAHTRLGLVGWRHLYCVVFLLPNWECNFRASSPNAKALQRKALRGARDSLRGGARSEMGTVPPWRRKQASGAV